MQEVLETHLDSEKMAVTHFEAVPEPIKESVNEKVVYQQIDTSSEPKTTRIIYENHQDTMHSHSPTLEKEGQKLGMRKFSS